MRKILLLAVAAFIAITTFFILSLLYFKPFNINHFYERAFFNSLLKDPETLSSTRLLDGYGLNFYNDELTDISDATDSLEYVAAEEDLKTLLSYNYESLSEEGKVSYDIMKWQLENKVAMKAYRHHSYPVNQLFGVQSDVPDFLINIHQVNGKDDAKDYISRLNAVEKKFNQLIDILAIRERKGIVPPKFVLNRVIKEISDFTAQKVEENPLYTTFVTKVDSCNKIKDKKKPDLKEAAAEAIKNKVYPSYAKLLSFLQRQEQIATTDDGAWKLPGGERYYNQKLKQNTTTDLTAQQIHEIGLKEVARIQSEMKAILKTEGYSDTASIGWAMSDLAKQPRFLYPNNNKGRDSCLKEYQRIIDEISANLDNAFNVKPKAGVKVERIPTFKEKTAPGAYYNGPAADGSRPGIFYAKLYDMNEIPKFGMRTLSYHEAVPGHHFQIAIQQELQDLPTFRKFMGFTAYAEGWALYSEQLAYELGFQKVPTDNLGRLQDELFRAVRLVVDTGIHRFKWTREEAIDYMRKNTGMPIGDVTAEIERYIVMPGQACAYKIGMLKILDLREKAKSEMGAKFSLKEFHNVVLKNGSQPLSVLESNIKAMIRKSKEA